MRWAGYVEGTAEDRHAYRVVVGRTSIEGTIILPCILEHIM
jgi:hypothetical protein